MTYRYDYNPHLRAGAAMTVFNVQTEDSENEKKVDAVEAKTSQDSKQKMIQLVDAPNKILEPSPKISVGKMTIERRSDSSATKLTMMISKLSVKDVRNEDDINNNDDGGYVGSLHDEYVYGHHHGSEEDELEAEGEEEERDDWKEDGKLNDDGHEENIIYTERGPVGARSRKQSKRTHPYGLSGTRDAADIMSPASSTEANDSSQESSIHSSPDSSPHHDVSINIPARHYYASAGIVTVVSPVARSPSIGSPQPLDTISKRRQSLCAGGGLVMPTTTGTPERPLSLSPMTNLQDVSPSFTFPLSGFQHRATSPVKQPPSSSPRSQGINIPDITEQYSPYSTYRDPASSKSPFSSTSPSVDESHPFTLSPFSDGGGQQASPSSAGELHEQQMNMQLLMSVEPLSEAPCDHVQVLDDPCSPPFFCDIADVASSLFNDPDGLPDPDALYKKYVHTEERRPGFFENMYEKCRSTSDLGHTGDYHFVPQQNPPLRHHSIQLSPLRIPTLLLNASYGLQQNQEQKHATARISPPASTDIKSKIEQKMSTFVKILPKTDVSLPVPTPSTSVQSVPVAINPAHSTVTVSSLENPVWPSLDIPPGPSPFLFAVDRMRAMSTVQERNTALVRVEQNSVEDLAKQDKSGDTALHVAVAKGDYAMVYAIVTRLATKNLESDIKNSRGQTPLFVAVVSNQPVMVEFLLHYGADAGNVCRDGRTPLHVVASAGDSYYDVAAHLCASPTVKFNYLNVEGFTALHVAVTNENNCLRLAQLFVRSGASLTDPESCTGKTPMHLAVEKGTLLMVKNLCESDTQDKIAAAVNATCYVNNTPLHSAAMVTHLSLEFRLELINTLLMHGASPMARNKSYKLPKDLLPPDSAADKSIQRALNTRKRS